MNITPVDCNQKKYAINSQKQNVQFKATKGAALVNVLKEKGGNISTEEMNIFLKQNFGRFSGKCVKDILEDLLPYIAGLAATSVGLSVANNALKTENKLLHDNNETLNVTNNRLQEEKHILENEYKKILESRNISNIVLNKNSMEFEYNDVKYRMDIRPDIKKSKQKILLDVMEGKELPEGVKIVEVKTSTLPSVDTIKIINYFESYNPTVSDIENRGPIYGGREYAIDRYEASRDPHAGKYRCYLTYEYNGKKEQINDYFYGKNNKSFLKQKVTDKIKKRIEDDVKSLEATTEENFAKIFNTKK